jgi:hypothetical protein
LAKRAKRNRSESSGSRPSGSRSGSFFMPANHHMVVGLG